MFKTLLINLCIFSIHTQYAIGGGKLQLAIDTFAKSIVHQWRKKSNDSYYVMLVYFATV